VDEKLLVIVAPCAAHHVAQDIPNLDLSPEGIADEVVRAYNAGANGVHLHVIDEHGQPTVDLAAFERTVQLIRQRCDIIIEGSTGGEGDLTPPERAVALRADIEMATLNCGSVNFQRRVFVNSPSDIAYWAQEMKRRAVKPDMIIFDSAMIASTQALAEEGWIEPPYLYTFLLGEPGTLPGTPKNLLFLSEAIPPRSLWFALGHGRHDVTMATLAIASGGHVRAGLEDNAYYRPGELAVTNAQLIERLVRVAQEVGRVIATPTEAREMLGLTR
jgi:3-keto-5-aminohexanoate cleavage enzyme